MMYKNIHLHRLRNIMGMICIYLEIQLSLNIPLRCKLEFILHKLVLGREKLVKFSFFFNFLIFSFSNKKKKQISKFLFINKKKKLINNYLNRALYLSHKEK